MACLPPVCVDSSGPAATRDSPSHLWKKPRMIRTKCLSNEGEESLTRTRQCRPGSVTLLLFFGRHRFNQQGLGELLRTHSTIVVAEARAGSGTLTLPQCRSLPCLGMEPGNDSAPIFVRSCHGEWIRQSYRKPLLRVDP